MKYTEYGQARTIVLLSYKYT